MIPSASHIEESILDEYALLRLGEPQVVEVEGHIVFCDVCQDRLRRLDDLIEVFGTYSARLRRKWVPVVVSNSNSTHTLGAWNRAAPPEITQSVRAIRFVRKMRGGAQAHLVEANDARFYVVKFRNNPQHRRVLLNEWLASALLSHLRLSGAPAARVEFSAAFLATHPEVHIRVAGHCEQPEPGWHFGSCYPGDPARLAVYDFLPDGLLGEVSNAEEFAAMLVFDQWMGNRDYRQAIFHRIADGAAPEDPRCRDSFAAKFIDHGCVFNGWEWNFRDSGLSGLYHRRIVYRGVGGLAQLDPWIEQIRTLPVAVFDGALGSLCPWWVGEDGHALNALVERLLHRRTRVADLVRTAIERLSPSNQIVQPTTR